MNLNKTEYMKCHNITVRRLTPEERRMALEKCQIKANYAIRMNGKEWYSRSAGIRDMKLIVRYNKS